MVLVGPCLAAVDLKRLTLRAVWWWHSVYIEILAMNLATNSHSVRTLVRLLVHAPRWIHLIRNRFYRLLATLRLSPLSFYILAYNKIYL